MGGLLWAVEWLSGRRIFTGKTSTTKRDGKVMNEAKRPNSNQKLLTAQNKMLLKTLSTDRLDMASRGSLAAIEGYSQTSSLRDISRFRRSCSRKMLKIIIITNEALAPTIAERTI